MARADVAIHSRINALAAIASPRHAHRSYDETAHLLFLAVHDHDIGGPGQVEERAGLFVDER